jgi:uncharacterized protein
MINILYYHGLDSVLSDEKRKILENFGNVIAPTFDYKNMPVETVLTDVLDINYEWDVDVVIGSSFGGLMAYTIARLKDMKCLLFNPALYDNSLGWDMDVIVDKKRYNTTRTELAYIVLGMKDRVVDYKKNVKYIKKHVNAPYNLNSDPELEHRIPVDIFEEHVKCFFQTVHPSFILFD